MAMQDFRIRLPEGIAAMAREIADDEGQPVATYLSQIICSGIRQQVALHANAKASAALDQFVDLATTEAARLGAVEKSVTPPQRDKSVHQGKLKTSRRK